MKIKMRFKKTKNKDCTCKYCHNHFLAADSRALVCPECRNKKVSCDCGCGTIFNKYDDYGRYKKFVQGHHMKTKDARERISKKFSDIKLTKKHKDNQSIGLKKAYDIGSRVSWNKKLTKYDHPSIMNISKKLEGNMPWNKDLTKNDHAGLMSTSMKLKNRKFRKETLDKMSESRKELFKTPRGKEILKAMIKRLHIKPNKLEKRVIGFINKYNLPFKYVGDGQVIIGCKNPDFINCNGEKVLIEVFGRYWHDKSINPKVLYHRTEKGTIKHYAKYGFKTIIVWDDELKKSGWEEELLKKLKY